MKDKQDRLYALFFLAAIIAGSVLLYVWCNRPDKTPDNGLLVKKEAVCDWEWA